jgi:hypothetical protein
MSLEVLLISYGCWSVFATLIYRIVDESWVAMASHAFFGSIAAALPVGCFLLIDGTWCEGDCTIIAYCLFVVSLAVFTGRTGDWLSGLAIAACRCRFLTPREPGLHPGDELCDDADHPDRHGMHPTGT